MGTSLVKVPRPQHCSPAAGRAPAGEVDFAVKTRSLPWRGSNCECVCGGDRSSNYRHREQNQERWGTRGCSIGEVPRGCDIEDGEGAGKVRDVSMSLPYSPELPSRVPAVSSLSPWCAGHQPDRVPACSIPFALLWRWKDRGTEGAGSSLQRAFLLIWVHAV